MPGVVPVDDVIKIRHSFGMLHGIWQGQEIGMLHGVVRMVIKFLATPHISDVTPPGIPDGDISPSPNRHRKTLAGYIAAR